MNPLKTVVLLMSFAFLAGCASVEETGSVAFPSTTPFDSNAMARQAYLDGYLQGYRTAESTGRISNDNIRGPYQMARELGFRAGATAAINERAGAATSQAR